MTLGVEAVDAPVLDLLENLVGRCILNAYAHPVVDDTIDVRAR